MEQLIVRVFHPLIQAGARAQVYFGVVGGRLVPVREGGPVTMENGPAQGEAQACEDDPDDRQDQEGRGLWEKGGHEAKENRGEDDEDPFPKCWPVSWDGVDGGIGHDGLRGWALGAGVRRAASSPTHALRPGPFPAPLPAAGNSEADSQNRFPAWQNPLS